MQNHSNSDIRETTRTLGFSVVIASTLAISKFIVGFITQSMAILASALDSLMDVASSSVNFLASRKAAKPPDEDHAYGHGKIESLAGLFQSTLIGTTGVFLLIEAGKRFFFARPLHDIPIGIGVMVFSLSLTLILVRRLTTIAKANPSIILATEKLHYVTDVLHNVGVIFALLLVKWTGSIVWDLLVSLIVSLYIFHAAWQILTRSVDELLDKSLPPRAVENIRLLILNFHPSVGGLHNFRSRRVGQKIFLDFHIEIKGEHDFEKAHLMTESLIGRIREKYPEADVTVHYDPEGGR